jgi:hypothetical protein
LPTRRQFLKVGIAGAMVLASGRWLEGALAAPARGFRVLDDSAASILARFVPLVLAGALPAEREAHARAVREVIEAFDRAVSVLSPPVQEEVQQLFSLLRFSPMRVAFTGLWETVEDSTASELEAFLLRWRHSRFDIQRAGYQALTQLIQAAWFDNPSAWPAIGYPGPPALGNAA